MNEEDIIVQRIRGMIEDRVEPHTFASDEIFTQYQLLEANEDATAAHFWRMKAARFAHLIDVTEGSSTRNLSNLQANALKMAGIYSVEARAGEAPSSSELRPSRTRRIVRP